MRRSPFLAADAQPRIERPLTQIGRLAHTVEQSGSMHRGR